AGIGYGGSCFPKDSLALKQLASNSGYPFQLLSAVTEVKELQKRPVFGKLKKRLGSPWGKKVAPLGRAFKPDNDDMRGAPATARAGCDTRRGVRLRRDRPPELGHGCAPRDGRAGLRAESLVPAEAIILAGGKGERMGDAAAGRPKSLVEVAGLPLVTYQIGRLA